MQTDTASWLPNVRKHAWLSKWPIAETLLRYYHAEQAGRFREQMRISQHERGNEISTEPRLPPIVYLASDPRTHRSAREQGLGLEFFWFGVRLPAAIIPFRLSYKAASQRVQIPVG